ncbi:TPA: hypothetical protein QCQ87_001312 [Bacillus paranthracis]|uniref:hypothetical protein n=1 Tax=Bacillus cereus group sp. MYBK101-2 TaxID=3450700 RepID=UPI0032FB321D|nr:hypothetical protein [Bacillus paranthracis]
MRNYYLNEAIGAVNTYVKIINDHALEDGDGKEIINKVWHYNIEDEAFIVILICYGKPKKIFFNKREWNHPEANMLANSKLERLMEQCILT